MTTQNTTPRPSRAPDRRADLLQDLRAATPAARSAAARTVAAPVPPVPASPARAGTPALAVRFTPLSWSWPCARSAPAGGIVVRLGPLTVALGPDCG
jgi:hypothetical protein